jgi:TetR/AcrR family transcriptional regulator, regulator of cefoperazone and chloramphenicol sensitivity
VGSIAENERLGPDSRDKSARVQSLIDAATELFASEGYGPVSTRRIAEAAGCSETLLFRYFGGKSGLLRAISTEFMDRPAHPADLSVYDEPGEMLEAFITQVLRGMKAQTPSLKIMMAALVNEPDLARDFEARHLAEVEMVTSNLLRLQASGAIAPSIDVRAVATGVEQMAFAMGFLLEIVYQRDQDEVLATARTIATALGQGLQGPVSSSSPLPRALRRETLTAADQMTKNLEQLIDLINGWPGHDGPAETPPSRVRRLTARR